MKVKFIEKDVILQEEQTNYWFEIDGISYAIAVKDGEYKALDHEGYPITNDLESKKIIGLCINKVKEKIEIDRMIKLLKTEPFSDYVELVDVYGQGCNYPTGKGLDGYQVDFTVAVNDKTFNIKYQTAERYDNIMAYNGYEMTLATSGNGDESEELIDYCEELGIDGVEEFLNDLEREAESLAKAKLELLEEEQTK